MRDPDINRVKKALSHITTARQFLDKIQWLNTDQTFSKMDNVASQGKLMVGMGICTDDEAKMLGQ